MTERLSNERLEKIRQLIVNPRPGSKVAAATEFGIDLTLTLGQLRKTPQERIDDLQSAMLGFEEIRKAGEKMRNRKND